jgi:hypothetical protein
MDKQKGISTTLSILLIVLLVVIVGGGVVYKYYLAPGEEPSDGKPEESQDETADWEIYRNEEFGFGMKYPVDWEILHKGYSGHEIAFYHISFSPKNLEGPHAAPITILVHNDNVENVSKLISTYEKLKSESEVIVDNRDSKKQVRLGPEGEFSVIFVPGIGGLTYELRYNNPQFKEVFNKALPTFKFLEEEEKEGVVRIRIHDFINHRIGRSNELIEYLTENAILKLGGEANARQYLEGTTNPHLYKYEITSITEIPKGTPDYLEGGYKVIIRGHEEYTGEEEVNLFTEGLNLIKINNQWLINEIIKKQYN